MATISWNKDKLVEQLNYLKGHNEDHEYDFDIALLNDLLSDVIVPYSSDLDLEEKLKVDKMYFDKYSYFLDSFRKVSNIHIPKYKNKFLDLRHNGMSIEEPLDFAYDFFRSLNPEWFNIFESVWNERHNNLQTKDIKRSYSIYVKSLDYSYIAIGEDNSIVDFFSIVHEFAHTIADRIKFRYVFDYNYPFSELPSLFCELVLKNQLKFEYEGLDSDIKKYMLRNLKVINGYSKDMISTGSFFSTYNLENDIISNVQKFTNGNKALYDSLTNTSQLEKLNYTVAMMYAIELYYVYKEDKELAFYLLDVLIKMENKENYLVETEKLGLVPASNFKRFVREIRQG